LGNELTQFTFTALSDTDNNRFHSPGVTSDKLCDSVSIVNNYCETVAWNILHMITVSIHATKILLFKH